MSSLLPAPTQNLPADLIELFLDFVGDDRETLLNFSRVLRSWRDAALPRIFRCITLDSQSGSMILRFPKEFTLEYLVKRVEITGRNSSGSSLDPAFHHLLKCLTRLETVKFTRCDFSYLRFTQTAESLSHFEELTLALCRPSVQVIILEQTRYVPLPLLVACPNFKHLEAMNGNKFVDYVPQYVAKRESPDMQMESIHVGGVYNIDCLGKWLGTMPKEYRFSKLSSLHISDAGYAEEAVPLRIAKLLEVTGAALEELCLNLRLGPDTKFNISSSYLRPLERLKRLTIDLTLSMVSLRHGSSLQLAGAGIGRFVQNLPTLGCLEHFKLVHRLFVQSNEPVQSFADTLTPLIQNVDDALGCQASSSNRLGRIEIQIHVFSTSTTFSLSPRKCPIDVAFPTLLSLGISPIIEGQDYRPEISTSNLLGQLLM
ncbi:hypothetical protein D9756_006074 [Leucocoprinus leucothites]|uniref:F-box domain-containing protein n=1 Tax=Leucocoprinus leucothites TaxID=201217 RepID=A0A8H5D588_9AGAR|nr:hypothetical protein D9756_006074 [Leucoagaricus leucothites]